LDATWAEPAYFSLYRRTRRGSPFGEKQPAHVDLSGEQLIEDDERQCAEEEQDFVLQDGGD